ncbi:hypothetical protein PR003_g10157 [Phytophthora rubi]|uniref:Vacuolar protein sorting-associated protein n=1 Tax=Phytophthora rubi TaxID=129364 RepID=A0A6A4FS28_9STRA|nr:hypothetical protein PR003_g10157 [Phytophthora rubi]
MFETLVTGLLTSALGSYIEPKCFSSDKINVAVWSGYVVLTELEVKPEVVAELPAVRLVRGLVGSIELKIPWNRLQSDSVVATVDDVYLLLRTEEDIDAVMRQMDEFTLKKKLLEELYAQAKRQEQETADAAATEDGFAARLVNKIIDNLELHIRRIHIRIEDHSSGDHPFAMGLTIESVHVQSTNSNWQPSYVDTAKNNEPRIFKIVELNHLSVYCNPDCELQRDRQVDFETCSAEEFSSAFSRAIPKRFDDRHYHHMQLYPSQQQHHFLLKPIDASARLIVNRDVFDANVPKFEIDVNVSEVAFRLEESQYCDMLYLASALQIPDHYTKYQRHRKFRPQAAVFDDPAEWWRYAITAVLKDQQAKKQQWTWGFMKDRREDRKQYVGLWQQKSRQLLELADVDYVYSDSDDNDDADDNGNTEDDEQGVKPGLSPLDQANIQRLSSFEIDAGLEEIERRRSTEDVLFFRYLADLEVRNFRATRASRVRRRLPTPPTHKSHAFSDTDSVDTEMTESSVPAEVRYRSWGAWMFGWTSKLATPSPDGESGQAPHRIIPEVELRELFKILEEPSRRTKKRMHKHREAGGPDDVSDSESQMELSELYRVTVTLQRGSVTLASDPETNKTLLRDDPSYGRKYAPTDFLLGTFSQLQVAAVARDETVAVDVSLQSIEAFDESAESSAFSRLLSRKQTIRPAGDGDDVNVSKLSGVVFLMSYEMNPATSSADASLFVHMEPLEIVLSPTARCWGRLAKFMDTPSSLGLWEELEVASFNDIVNLKTRTEAKLDYVMENRIALAVDLRIQAPVIIVPESDTDYNCARLVVDLGRINFRTDRLSQMDSDQMSMSCRSAPGSIALLSPSHFRGANSNTSFVQQLYDEAERGEGAIRWKEEFYDKFSLSITNIHVLLIPYGKTSRVQDDGAGSSGMNYPSVSLPPYLTNIYDEEQEYELVERFNINVTVRMSILPLDATLTRFYIHADLPALTFNLSLEKYFQLLALADRFSLANAEVPKKTRKYSGGAFYSAESAYGNDEINMPNSEDGHEAMRRGSFLSTSALKKFMLNDNESIGPPSANELFEESSLQLALVPASSRNGMGSGDITSANTDDGLPPPFELTPTIKQEYSIPVNLTESVRADLERARKNLFEQAPDTLKIPVAAGDNDALPVALKLGIRLHSVSVCFSDRGESVVSLAVLDSQVQVGTAKAGQIHVSGLVGDVKVFDLSSKKRQEDGLGISGAARGLESPADYIEIFGLDTSVSFSTGDIRHVLSVDCLISSESNLTASEGNVQARQNKSRLSVSVQPVRFLAQPEFVENLANYVVDGPLRTHFLSKHVALSDAGMENERKRADSMADFQLAPRFSPNADHPPESLTPFFDAVDTTNRDGRQLKFEATSPQTPPPCDIVAANAQENQSVQGNDSAKRDGIALIVAHIIDNFDLEVKLFHPCVVLPSTPLKDIRVSLQSQPYRGIVLDFGTILITLRREISDALPDGPVCTPYQAKVTVKSLQITSLADQTAILDPSGFEIRCSIPAQDMNYDDRGTNGALPGISLDVEIYQVCLNVSETNACLALEVFYVAVIPMFDTTQEVIRQLESYERVLVAEPATLRPEDGGDFESASFGANGDMTKWGQLSLHFLLEEFKIAFISYSEAPQQFETWMKSVIDIPDEVSSRESSGGASSAAQGRSYPQHFMGRRGSFPSEIPCCVIGEIALVAIEANLAMGLEGKPLMDSDVQLQCDFSLQEVIIRDKIADPTEFLTHLFAPVPGALLERMDSRTSISSDSSSISFLSRDDMLPPVLRPSTSHSSRMDVSSSQISGRLTSKRGVGAGFDSAVTVNSLDVSVSSARFILLPRTLLRLEHFVLDVFLAASKKRSEMEIQRDEALVNNPPGVENAAYADAAIDMDDNRGERQESRFTVPPLRPRNDSISESLKDDLNAVRSAFMSPLQRMLSSASAKDTRPPGSFTSRVIAEETGSGTSAASKTKSPGSVGQGDADRRRLPIPQWKVDARFSNLQMWVISTDRKADVAGCVLSHQLIVKFDSALDGAETSTASDSNEIVAASVRLSKVEVSVGSPKTADLDFSTAELQSKPTYHTGTLVESFEVDVQFGLRHCFRPTLAETIDPESSDEKSDENSEMNSGDAYNGDTGGDADAKAGPWVNYSPTNKADSAAVSLPELFLRDVPSEWQEWLLCEPTVRIDQIVSHIAYRDLPLLLKISASLASMLSAEKKIRDAFVARLKTATDDLDWTDLPDAPGDYSEYAHYFGAEDLDDSEVSRQDEPSVPQYDVLTRASLIASGIQFRLINNIVDQASPVVEFDSKAIEVLLRSESNSMVEVTACCRAEAMYQNLRLVTMEPLIEPWSVKVVLSQQRSHGRSLDDRGQLALSPWKLDISSDVFLQLNLTDALIANLVAADRAWRWVVNAGGDSREMTEYSTYWIRNNTGMPLRYWGASYNEHSLAPGQEEPLRFNKEQPEMEAVTLTSAGMNAGWETREQRLRERGTISAADSLIWHLSSEETPLELSVRMKGFDWSEPLELEEDLGDIVRIKMKDLVSDAYLYITAEIRMSKGHCRELFLYVPYWIVNLTGLKLEYEYDEERMGREHTTTLLAGQKRLDRDELLLKESQRAKASRRDRNPHLLHPVLVETQEFIDGVDDIAQQSKSSRSASPDNRESERKRRHPRLLPSVPPVKGLLDLLPKTIEYDPRSLGQLEVLQACHSDYRLDRGCVRLRVSNDRDMAALDARKENGQRKWSDPFVLDQAGTIGEIEADDYGANRKFSIGYSIIPAKGQYSRTKVIMLTPRFMLINTMSSAIEVCHSSSKMMTPSVIDMANTTGSMPNSRVMSPVNPVVQLDAGAFADFHWTLRFAKTRTIRCRFAEYGWSWSGAVPLVESGEYAVRMRHESTRESKLVRVTLKLDSSCVCVYFREERTTAPPYRVENYSLETLRTHQHRVRRSEILLPHHSLDYAWDEPTEERLLVVDMLPSAAGDNSRPLRIGSFDLDKIQQYPDALGGTLGIEISTDGPTRVLRFTDTRLRGKKAVPVNSKVANDLAAKTEGTENSALQLLQRFVAVPTVHAALHLQGVGISIADSAPKELVYMSISGIALEILVSEDDRNKSAGSIAGSAASLSRLERETRPRIIACCLEVNDVQVDNQLQVTPYPVLLRFSNPNGRSRIVNGQTVSIPVLQVGLVKHDEYAGIEFIRHFSVSVLPVHIRVDGALLYQILPLLVHAKIYGSGGNSATTTKKRAVVLVNGGSSSDEVSRAAHSHLLLKDFNASLEVPVKVLEAAQKDGTTSAGPTSGPPTPTMKMVSRRSSGQQQLISPRQNHQHTALAAEIQRYTATKYGSIGAIAVKDEQKKLYFEEFHIDPIRATVSFSFGDSAGAILDGHLSSLSHAAALTDPSSSRDSSVITVGPLRLILNAIGTSLTKIANAPFQLKALHIHNSFVQPDALATRLASHYQSEALRQAYVILGSVDVLGNPMIAWKNLRSGFQDFISEPAHGLSQRSPQAFAFGVGRGSLSLVRASVYTFLDFNTRILTAFSLGLSEACLKLDDYTGYPATRHIFQGLVQGVSGVVVAPIHSFEVNGARGVLPGLVAGAFGVVLKPLLGFSLATATTAATLRDAVDPNTKALLVRVRPPRHIDLRTKRLKVYSYVESLGEEIVGKIRGGRYRADGYLGHVDLKATHQCFLVTRKRILFLNVKGLASAQTTKYEVQWELLAEEVVMVDCSRTPSEQIITIYYMEDEFRAANGAGHSARVANGSNAVTTTRRRTPGVPRGMFLQKHEVALPDTKVLFVRAMLQQQERSLLTKMNSYTKDGTPHHLSPLARTNSMDLSSAWQPQHPHMPMEYPIFRLPPSLHQTRSFANLAQTNPSHTHHYNQQQKS